jgi:Arc/MetJ-type ribon-helix-helix transcriptional regulator
MSYHDITMVRTQVQLTEEQIEKLRRLAAAGETSVSDVVRQAVDALTAFSPPRTELQRRALAACGTYASGTSDVSEEHDRHLAEAFGSS